MGRTISPPFLRNYGSNDLQIYKINEDLGNNCQTILEMIGEGNKTCLTQFINRGTDYVSPGPKPQLIYYYILIKYGFRSFIKKTLMYANTMVVKSLIKNFKKPKKCFGNNEAPIACLLWFSSSDILQHKLGYDSFIYKLNLLHIDKAIGLLLSELEKMGYLEDTVIAITTDHGNYKAKKVGEVMNFLKRNGLVQYRPKRPLKGNMDLSEFGGVGFFNFKGSNSITNKYGWTRPSVEDMESYGPKHINLFNELFKVEGSYRMYYRDDGNSCQKGRIILKRKSRKSGKIISGAIEYQGTGLDFKTKYISDNGEEDVFGYLNDVKASKLIDNKFHSIQEWLEATNHLDFPIYPDLIPRHFKNPRSSDIILSTDGSVLYNIGHGKKEGNFLYSHDIGLRKSAIVPLIISGTPEIPQKEIPFCKTPDVVPTLLKLLGKNPHKSVIGNNLI